MSDPGIAFIAALGGGATGALLTAFTANWLQTKQGERDVALQAERLKADRAARADEEKRRIKREHLAPVFAVMSDLELVYAHRVADWGLGKTNYDTLPTELQAALTREEVDVALDAHRQERLQSLGAPPRLPTALKSGVASLRVADDPNLSHAIVLLSQLIGDEGADLTAVGRTLASTQQMLLRYAAKNDE